MATHKMHVPGSFKRHSSEITGVAALILIAVIFGIVYAVAVANPRDHASAGPLTMTVSTVYLGPS